MIDKNKIKWDMFKGDCEKMNWIKLMQRRKNVHFDLINSCC